MVAPTRHAQETGRMVPFDDPAAAFPCPAMPWKTRRDYSEIGVRLDNPLRDGRFVVTAV
jgi:hypothetical protein